MGALGSWHRCAVWQIMILGGISAGCGPRQQPEPQTSKTFEPFDDEPATALTPKPNRPPEQTRAELRSRPPRRTVMCTPPADVCASFDPLHTTDTNASLSALLASKALRGLQALRLPAPRTSVQDHGALFLYIDPDEPLAAPYADPGSTAGAPHDTASAFVITPPLTTDCRSQHDLARAVAGASLLAHDAATDATVLSMLGAHLANLLEPCADLELEQLDAMQRAPERTFVGPLFEPAPGAFLFPQFLEDRFGTDEPGRLTAALIAISSQRTLRGALVDEPDMFDALRVTQSRNGSSVDDTLLEFAINRAFMGSRSDDLHMLDVAKLGDAGRVRFEWQVDHSTLPRSLAPLRPIEPLGATYVLVTLDSILPGAELTFSAEWEEPANFRWAIIKLKHDGSELGRSEVTPVLGEYKIQRDVRDLGGARALLIVGLHEGATRRDEPFDPGQFREMPRGYTMTLYP